MGGGSRTPRQMADFNLVLAEVALADLGYEGYQFTWPNGMEYPNTVRCRLHRVCVKVQAIDRFPTAYVTHLEVSGSDHLPILLKLERPVQFGSGRRSRPFRFEAIWVRKKECEDIVRHVWEREGGANSAGDMVFKWEECQLKLVQWSKNSNPSKLIEQTQKEIMEIRKGDLMEGARNELIRLTGELDKLYQDQAMYWRQRGKAA